MTTVTIQQSPDAVGEQPVPRQIARRDLDRLRRYREYLDYYEGRRGGPPRQGRQRVLTFNYAPTMVEKGASYLVTEHRPVVTPTDDSVEARRRAAAAERALLRTWEENDLAGLDLETEIDTAVLGDGAFKVVWDGREHRLVGGRRCPPHLAHRLTLRARGGPVHGTARPRATHRRRPRPVHRGGGRGVDRGTLRPVGAGRPDRVAAKPVRGVAIRDLPQPAAPEAALRHFRHRAAERAACRAQSRAHAAQRHP